MSLKPLCLLVCLAATPLALRAETSSCFSADSSQALIDYWHARQRGATLGMVVGGALAMAGGGTLALRPQGGSTTLRDAGLLATVGGGLTLIYSALLRFHFSERRLQRLLHGESPISQSLWRAALDHRKRLSLTAATNSEANS